MNADDVNMLHPGETFHGYVIQRCLGQGSAAAVYLAKHEVLDAFFALKILHPSIAADDDSDFLRRFLREARLAIRVRHPNLVTVHDCGYDTEKGLYYLVMDYVPGSSLRNSIAFEGRLSASQAAAIVAQVASALEAARSFQVVHRDIKPENIMVQPDGCVKLVDLGIAKARNLGDSISTNTDSTFGTPSYISPEQVKCFTDVDARADVYSLGIVFFEMLTGKCPYAENNPAQVLAQILSDDPIPDVRDFAPDIPAELAILVRRMTVKDRGRRIPSFKVVLDELGRLGLGNVEKLPRASAYAPSRPTEDIKSLLNGIGKGAKSQVDPLADLDEDTRELLERKTRSSARKALVWKIAAAIAVAVTLLIVLLICL